MLKGRNKEGMEGRNPIQASGLFPRKKEEGKKSKRERSKLLCTALSQFRGNWSIF